MTTSIETVRIDLYQPQHYLAQLPDIETPLVAGKPTSLAGHPVWLRVFEQGLNQTPYLIVARRDGATVGWLPLAYLQSALFGRFLVSLPYVNTGGVIADDPQVARALIDRAVQLSDELDVRYLELRHESPREHPALNYELTSKVHMRLPLCASAEQQWNAFRPKVRNQIRKAEGLALVVNWGGSELLGDFYTVFSRNMRDLGTPVFGRPLFEHILKQFPGRAEICAVRFKNRPVAAALVVHGHGVTEVPSASSLRAFNDTNANMLMYWNLLVRSIERGQQVFDFGRSSEGSNTFRFKKQWGAMPEPACWQYYVRQGSVEAMRPENARNQRLIRLWQRLPVALTRLIGPFIVRGIP